MLGVGWLVHKGGCESWRFQMMSTVEADVWHVFKVVTNSEIQIQVVVFYKRLSGCTVLCIYSGNEG